MGCLAGLVMLPFRLLGTAFSFALAVVALAFRLVTFLARKASKQRPQGQP